MEKELGNLFNEGIKKLQAMSTEELEKTFVEILEESGIKYHYDDNGNIQFDKKNQEDLIPNELRMQMKTAYDWLQLTNDIAIDYDGYGDSEGLMSLIDEMKAYIVEAMKCIDNGDYK